jgi:mRNA-degrading endonuclease HigB of HigAB toxin-antitoxin module
VDRQVVKHDHVTRLQRRPQHLLDVREKARVIDRATYEKPAQFSEGIRHVLVGGAFVVRDEQLVANVDLHRFVCIVKQLRSPEGNA